MNKLDNISINLPALKRPTLKELQKDFPWITSIEKDDSTEDAGTLELMTVLRDGESYISGTEYEKRLPKNLLGFQHIKYIEKNQSQFPELLEYAKKEGFWYINFYGIVVVNSRGFRSSPCLDDGARRWRQSWYWMSRDLIRRGRVAVSSKLQLDAGTIGLSDTLTLGALTPLGVLQKKYDALEAEYAGYRKAVEAIGKKKKK